jgi:hypothetical protein
MTSNPAIVSNFTQVGFGKSEPPSSPRGRVEILTRARSFVSCAKLKRTVAICVNGACSRTPSATVNQSLEVRSNSARDRPITDGRGFGGAETPTASPANKMTA